jgi:hypothetical protein
VKFRRAKENQLKKEALIDIKWRKQLVVVVFVYIPLLYY